MPKSVACGTLPRPATVGLLHGQHVSRPVVLQCNIRLGYKAITQAGGQVDRIRIS